MATARDNAPTVTGVIPECRVAEVTSAWRCVCASRYRLLVRRFEGVDGTGGNGM